MRHLNSTKARNQLADYITDYGHYSHMLGVAFHCQTQRAINTKEEQNLYDYQYIYYGFMKHHTEMQLARMGVYLFGALSKNRLEEYDFDNYQEHRENLDNMREAEKALEQSRKEVA